MENVQHKVFPEDKNMTPKRGKKGHAASKGFRQNGEGGRYSERQ